MSDMIGRTLGQYEITGLIGKGGMAVVYRAHQPSMGRDVAIKVIKPDLAESSSGDFVARFRREARTIASLSHSQILKVFDYGQQGDLIYLVMELLPGGGLADLLRRQPLGLPEAARLLDQIADALDYAHGLGIVHRDLKPQNVLLDARGNAILTDFGIAKLLSDTTALTQSGMAMGTPSYMAPEQWQNQALDGRADVYALGVMLFEMLTGRLPFDADTPLQMMYAHMNERPRPARKLRGDLPESIERVIARALAKRPEDRFQTAGALAAAFRVAMTGTTPPALVAAESGNDRTAATPAGQAVVAMPREDEETPRRGGRGLIVLIAVALIAVVVGGVAILGSGTAPTPTGSPSATIPVVAIIPTASEMPGETAILPSATTTITATHSETPSPAATATPALETLVAGIAASETAIVRQTIDSHTDTPTLRPTRTLTFTSTPDLPGTARAVYDATQTVVAIASFTRTPTATNTATFTHTPTHTPSKTPTFTVTPTLTPTYTPSKKPTAAFALSRDETLYFAGLQWGAVNGWNPYSSSNNNVMAVAQQDNARVLMFETPYLYNMLDGQVYPLLADGPYAWNKARTELTFRLKTAAHWSDGTPLRAEDAAYTWATHVRYGTYTNAVYANFIADVVATDSRTVVVKAKLNDAGKAVNPLMVQAYISSGYVIQKAWTQKLEKRAGGDANKLLADAAGDVIYSGPYHKYSADDAKVVLVRDDRYWGQNASMWGRLPAPRYLVHTIFRDFEESTAALKAGEVDVSQQFIPNVQMLWRADKLPISTYLPEAPYQIGASLPTAFFNLKSPGLDNPVIRRAIAMAVNYRTIGAGALFNQSATFDQVPRSLMNPTAGEQALYDQAAVADLQWVGNDIEGARALLDEAGIVDTNGDGWRELDGRKLSYVANSPNGWADWQVAIDAIAAAGAGIGIEITASYPEWSAYQVITMSDRPLPEGYDIFMMWSDGAGPAQPWSRIHNLLSSDLIGMAVNWSGNWGGYSNPAADALIDAIPQETDPARLKTMYTELVRIYLTDVPSFTLMYRPQAFHVVNESVWTNFPHDGDGTNPPIPPLNLIDGWGVAGLYNLQLVNR